MPDIHGRRINLRGILLRTADAIRSNLRIRTGRRIFTTFKQKHFDSVSVENMMTSSRCCELFGFEPLYREKRCEERGDHGPYQGLIEQERKEAFMNIAGVSAESWTSAHILVFEMNVFASSVLSSGVPNPSILVPCCHLHNSWQNNRDKKAFSVVCTYTVTFNFSWLRDRDLIFYTSQGRYFPNSHGMKFSFIDTFVCVGWVYLTWDLLLIYFIIFPVLEAKHPHQPGPSVIQDCNRKKMNMSFVGDSQSHWILQPAAAAATSMVVCMLGSSFDFVIIIIIIQGRFSERQPLFVRHALITWSG